MEGADLNALVLLPARPAWWAEAACRGQSGLDRRRARAGAQRRPTKRRMAGASGRWREVG